MRNILRSILVVFFVATVSSCSEDDGATYPTPTGFSVSPSAANVESAGGVVAVVINGGNLGWAIESSETWIKVSKAYGSGDATIELSIEANASEGPRNGSVVISPTFGKEPVTIQIDQN